MGRASNHSHEGACTRRADPFATVMGAGRSGRGFARVTATDAELLAMAMEKLPAQPEEFAEVADRFAGVAFAYSPQTMRVLERVQLDTEFSGPVTGYLVASKADGLGARAGSNAFVTFAVTLGEADDLDVFVYGESTDLNEAVDLLASQLREYVDDSEPAPRAVSAPSIRARLRNTLEETGR